jgi:hypothetical protein
LQEVDDDEHVSPAVSENIGWVQSMKAIMARMKEQISQVYVLSAFICLLHQVVLVVGEILVHVGFPEGRSPKEVSSRVFLNLRRNHKYRNNSLFMRMWEHIRIGRSPLGITP